LAEKKKKQKAVQEKGEYPATSVGTVMAWRRQRREAIDRGGGGLQPSSFETKKTRGVGQESG